MAPIRYPGKPFGVGSIGPAVRALQRQLNQLGNRLAVDGEYGIATAQVVEAYQLHRHLGADGRVDKVMWNRIFGLDAPDLHPGKHFSEADHIRKLREEVQRLELHGKRHTRRYHQVVHALKRMVAPRATLEHHVLQLAQRQVARGVFEQGGNNRGPAVEAVIRYAGGDIGEPWCVDNVIWLYGHAGSRIIRPGYPRAVSAMLVPGIVRTSRPRSGNVVRYTFDHTAVFDHWIVPGVSFLAYEGNTGELGAVSDGNGNDGVYHKERSASLVEDFLVVTA